MPFHSPTNGCKKLLAHSALTVTLVGSLALYHQTASIDRVAPEQRSWQADGINNPIANINVYCGNKIIIIRLNGVNIDKGGEKMRHCGLKFFRNNKI